MDSTIRLKQLNKPDLSGYVIQVLDSYYDSTGIQLGGNIIPSSSGIYDLGSNTGYYNNLYINSIKLPSGTGIYFGNDFFTAYQSGTAAVFKVNDYYITSDSIGGAISLIGPQGNSGVQGPSGSQGISGIGITGYQNVNNTLVLLYSNGTSGAGISLPSGSIGPTGISNTGYYLSGNYLFPLFSNNTTGTSFYIPSGQQGPQGNVGGIFIDFGQLTGFFTGESLPNVTIENIDPTATENPTLRLIKGMNYTFGYSGLNIATISGTGINYFVDSGTTGYLKFVVFDSSTPTGRYCRDETASTYSDILSYVDNTDSLFSSVSEGAIKSSLTFNVNLGAQTNYKYGFQKYSFADNGVPIDTDGVWGFYILGDIETNYFGPEGPSGLQGAQGIPGPQGEDGSAGPSGAQGTSITGVYRYDNSIQFLLSDGTSTDWILLPEGGPQGVPGPQGVQGIQGEKGETGSAGANGADGISDTYLAEFFPDDMNISGFVGFYKQISGSSTWLKCTGTGRVFQVGDKVWFSTDSLVGKAYSPWQKILFADDNFNSARYFYASVVSFNKNDGELQFVVENTPSPVGMISNYIQLYNYSLIDVNLGGLGSSGAIGPQGPAGPMGNTGHSIFQNSPLQILTGNVPLTIYPGAYDCWNLSFTDEANKVNFNMSTFSTGQTVLVKVKNSGILDNSNPIPLIYWNNDSGVYFPYGATAPAPNPGTTSILTFVRFPSVSGLDEVFCTYSLNYNV